MSRVTHFEISAKDPQKVGSFYSNVFEWKVNKWEGPVDYWLVSTGDPNSVGIDGGFYNPKDTPFSGTINTIEVKVIDFSLKKLIDNGGDIIVEKHAIPGIGFQAYCTDIEGNVFGIHQADPAAS